MTKLTKTITLLYAYQDADITKLAGQITERRRAVWVNTLRDLARTHGCSQYPGTPKMGDAKELARQSLADAQSIAKTFNRDLNAQINRIYNENPRANRATYYKRLNEWSKKRATWKNLTIGLNTDGTARYLATTRFYEMNASLSRSFVASGPPATCKICIRIFAAGVVTRDYVSRHPLPAHLNCPHFYRSAAPVRAQCGSLWLG